MYSAEERRFFVCFPLSRESLDGQSWQVGLTLPVPYRASVCGRCCCLNGMNAQGVDLACFNIPDPKNIA